MSITPLIVQKIKKSAKGEVGSPKSKWLVQFQSDEQNGLKNQQGELIVHHKFCIRLMKIFTLAGNIQTKQRIGEQIERKMYMISPHPKEKLSFDYKGDLQDDTQYKLLTLEPQQNQVDFIKKVNLVCKQLDDDFIPELQLLIVKYLNLKDTQNWFEIETFLVLDQEEQPQDIFQELIRYAQGSEFQYLKKWNEDKSLTYKQQLGEERQVLIRKLESHGYKKEKGKPFQNFKAQIIKNLEVIDEEMQFTPLQSLMTKLVNVFDQEFQDNKTKNSINCQFNDLNTF